MFFSEAHNTALLKDVLDKAQLGLMVNEDVERWKSAEFAGLFALFATFSTNLPNVSAGSTLAASIVQYYTALAMRSDKLFVINSTSTSVFFSDITHIGK